MDGSSKVHAVADSASASTSASNSSHIKLLIISSNEQIDDQIIEGDLQWTVKRLKTQLSLDYPGNPPVSEQKLIYCGKLLTDNEILKEVIRSYTNILHLVWVSKIATTGANKSAADKNKTTTAARTANATPTSTIPPAAATASSATAASSNSDILQQRRSALISFASTLFDSAAGTANNRQHNSGSTAVNSQQLPYVPNNQQANLQAYVAMQQMAMYHNWMQNVYAQYMQQWMHFNPNAAAGLPNDAAVPPLPTILQQPQAPAAALFPGMPPQFVLVYAGDLATAGQLYGAATAANPLIPREIAASAAAPVVEAAAADEPQPAPGAADQDDNEAMEWLDTFLSFTRFILFSLVVFFNATPPRFLIVMIVIALISLYRIRVERNIARNEALRIQREQEQDNDEQQQPLNDNSHEPSAESENSSEQAAPNQVSTLAFVRNIVVLFFTSLLPEPLPL